MNVRGALPTVSVVVPNFNGGDTLEATLNSLLAQDYPALEILVMDGGSTDGSAAILERHRGRLAHVVSEKDRGQAHAINKGMALATGEWLNWLCSDDTLLPGALHALAQAIQDNPTADVVAGGTRMVLLHKGTPPWDWFPRPENVALMPAGNDLPQPSTFFHRRMLRTPVLDESFHYAMDTELHCNLLSRGAHVVYLPQLLAHYPLSGANKTAVGGEAITTELANIYRRYAPPHAQGLLRWQLRVRHPLARLQHALEGVVPGVPWGRLMRPVRKGVDVVLGHRYGRARVDRLDWEWTWRVQ